MSTMVLSESENIAYGNAKQGSPPQLQPQLDEETMKDTPFSRQSSLLSLTLNEIQLKRGKSFGSMNMDEFLTNLWNVEENQVPSKPNLNAKPVNDNNGGKQQPNLARQGSFSLPAPLCKKTVDEVWFEIQRGETQQQQNSNNIDAHFEPAQRQQTLGEITLEDFLIKAGVVQEVAEGGSSSSQQNMVTPGNTCLDMNFDIMELGYQNAGNNLSAAVGNGFTAYQMFPQGKAAPNNAKNDKCQNMMEMGTMQHKKRIIDGPPEVVVERRQRRMIKNRESAARSRARKQAYTVELELELNQLKEENAKLKQIVEEIEQKRKEDVVKRKSSMVITQKNKLIRSIRRTVSLDW